MTRPASEVGQLAAKRLAADEERLAARRTPLSLGDAWRAFLRHPSPWILAAALAGSAAARVVVGDVRWTDAVVPVVLVAAFPFIEWLIHVCVLHWRPRRVGPVELDTLLARKHREHHADPRAIPLVFIPWQALVWLVPACVAVAVLASPRPGPAWTFLLASAALACVYEWTHYLVHSDYRPRSRVYRAIWRNHRLHHYKNEHYWFGVATAGTADRLLGTSPAVGAVATSPTVRALHATASRSA